MMGDAPRHSEKTPPLGHLLRSGGGIIFRVAESPLYSLYAYRYRSAIHFTDKALNAFQVTEI